MKRVINIGNRKQACKYLEQFKNKHYETADIEFTNVHLLKLNDKIVTIFPKDSLENKLIHIPKNKIIYKKREPNGAPIAIPWILTIIMQYIS